MTTGTSTPQPHRGVYELTLHSSRAFCLCTWHFNCPDVVVIDRAGFLEVFCRTCRVVGNVEAVGHPIAHSTSGKVPA